MLKHGEITEQIIGAAIEVHKTLGPGLLESAYHACLCEELRAREIPFRDRVALPVIYKNKQLEAGYEIDILVRETVVIELKSVQEIHPVFEAQLLTYMKLAEKPVGLLLNFNVEYLRNGLIRRVL